MLNECNDFSICGQVVRAQYLGLANPKFKFVILSLAATEFNSLATVVE